MLITSPFKELTITSLSNEGEVSCSRKHRFVIIGYMTFIYTIHHVIL